MLLAGTAVAPGLKAWMVLMAFVTSPALAVELGITSDGRFFTIDGTPTFLNGVSYYGSQTITTAAIYEQDLDQMVTQGYNWIRVWVHWAPDPVEDWSVLDRLTGQPREPYLSRLKTIIQEADERGMIVDVTESKGTAPFPPTHNEHKLNLQRLAQELLPYRNIYFDVANECNFTATPRYVTLPQMAELIATVKAVDPDRLCTASFAKPGQNIGTEVEIIGYVQDGHQDFISPHLCRSDGCSAKTVPTVRDYITWMKNNNLRVPINMQEPFRRVSNTSTGFPLVDDFYRDAGGAKISEAAAWCFHNGHNNDAPPDYMPHRSFDMRDTFGRLYVQLDAVEIEAIANVDERIGGTNMHLRKYQAEYAEHLGHDIGQRDSDAWLASPGTHAAGLLTRGPGITTVPGGTHRLIWRLRIDNNSIDNAEVVTLKATRGLAAAVLSLTTVRRQDFTAADTWQEFELSFTSTAGDALDFRTEWPGGVAVHLDWITLQMVSDNAPLIAADLPNPQETKAGSAYTLQLTLLQGDPAPSWTLLEHPAGSQVSSTGLVSGWTPASGEIGHLVPFTVEAANASGTDVQTWQVHVRSIADYDNDDDVDQSDFAFFQTCLSGSTHLLRPGCEPADLQISNTVDESDFSVFLTCMTGSAQQPGC
jgi:hypothetical protein